MLKEEINADAIFIIKERYQAQPISRVGRVNNDNERQQNQGNGKSFSEMLDAATRNVRETNAKKENDALRAMEGLNQYTNKGIAMTYFLSNKADYKA